MNDGGTNHDMHDLITPDMEERVICWVSGEASASESSELEKLAGTKPEIAAFRNRVEAMRDLALVAVCPDREPMKLSEERRNELMASFAAVRRRNLAFAASLTILLVAGVARYGEITHATPPIHVVPVTTTQIPFPVDTDPPIPNEESQAPREAKPDIGPPQLQDVPLRATTSDFTVPIEPPHPVVDITMTKIPTGGGGLADHPFNLSQLDEQPVAKYMARPVFPESMRRLGISGETVVDFIVDPNGNVRNATAIHSNHREFEEPACTAVRKWTFSPGRKGGRAVFVHMQVPIVFTLSQE